MVGLACWLKLGTRLRRYLGFDGFTSTVQDSLFKGYAMSIHNQMLYVNAFSSLVSLFGAAATTAPFLLPPSSHSDPSRQPLSRT